MAIDTTPTGDVSRSRTLTAILGMTFAAFLITNHAGELPQRIFSLAVCDADGWPMRNPLGPATYMLLHKSLPHLLWNMAWLIFFACTAASCGKPTDRIIATAYVAGGLAGGFFFIAINALLTQHGELCGASSAVISAATFITLTDPDRPVRILSTAFTTELKWIFLILATTAVLPDIQNISGGEMALLGSPSAHLGGIAAGIIIYRLYAEADSKNAFATKGDTDNSDTLRKLRVSGYTALSFDERRALSSGGNLHFTHKNKHQ